MPTLLEPSAPASGAGALNKTQKLAALLVMLGPEGAAQILKQFPPREIEVISREMARSSLITREQQQNILREFSEVALTASTAVTAGVDVARNVLEKAVGNFKASDILGRLVPSRVEAGALQTIADLDARSILNLIREEQPQTIAFVVSHLPPEKGAQLMGLLHPEQRGPVLERLATLVPTPIEVAEKVLSVLNAKMGVKQARILNQTGGVTPAADILNAMDKTISHSVLGELEQGNPELFQAIRKKMFTFEDLLVLSPRYIQRILRQIETRDLGLALKRASEPLRKLLLSNMSRRAAEAVVEETAALGPVKLRDVEAAQLRIIDAVRKLETDGEIDLEEARSTEYEMV